MKTTITAIVCLIAASTYAEGLKLGDAAPLTGTTMKNVDGKAISIADVTGSKGTLVIFSCNNCPFAKAWEGRIVELGNAYGKQGIGVIMINANDPAVAGDTFEALQERSKERGFTFPYVMDAGSVVAKAFGASRTPEVYLFDQAGKLVYHGAVDDNKDAANVKQQYLKAALDAVLAGQEVAEKETKAVGCSIKFYKQS